MSKDTIQYYNDNAESYIKDTINIDMNECLMRFVNYLTPGQRVLDAGCGSGRDILAFKKAGYKVEAFDASSEICRLVKEKTGVWIRQWRFEELEGESLYDGIWACASLVHVQRMNLPDVLRRINRLLKPGGFLYSSFKLGEEERIEEDGRYYCDMTEKTCHAIMTAAGFYVEELFVTNDTRLDRENEQWVNVIAKTIK